MLRDREFFLFILCVAALASGVYVTKETCPPNEEYQLCGSSCPFNCSNPEGPVDCADDCAEGCYCKNGFLRSENETCVSADSCKGGKPSICDVNEEFLACGTACPLTCSQPEQPVACGVACSMGCFCVTGFVRDEASGKCVTVDQCPTAPCLNPNEVYDICKAGCEPTCNDPVPICTKICAGGCVCASGYVRDDVTGACVTVNNCPVGNSTDPGLIGKYLNAINRMLHITTAN